MLATLLPLLLSGQPALAGGSCAVMCSAPHGCVSGECVPEGTPVGQVCFSRKSATYGASVRLYITERFDDDPSDRVFRPGTEEEPGKANIWYRDMVAGVFAQLANGRYFCIALSEGPHTFVARPVLNKGTELSVSVFDLLAGPEGERDQITVTIEADVATFISGQIKPGSQTGGTPDLRLSDPAAFRQDLRRLKPQKPEHLAPWLSQVEPDTRDWDL